MDTIVPVEFVQKKPYTGKIIPLCFGAGLLMLDQLTKFLVTTFIKPYSIGISLFGGLIRIVHVSNPGIAFSIGHNLSDSLRSILFAFAPLIVLAVVLVVYFRNNDFSRFQRWTIAGICGGGLGNLIDRFFRESGVVDFIDIKFFGIFGLDRWPTFNIADMTVLICGGMLLISFMIAIRKESRKTQVASGKK
jgi:signal peptidase II